ncbi:hypothetical protein ACFXPA_48605 [Amycolatopsis sp. NPDC059090]|uniref:hypothetical protein n=1 Tax=Amycolatopsis sp. NPDC059090 TaxID=3346723 RepID=UPI00366DC754
MTDEPIDYAEMLRREGGAVHVEYTDEGIRVSRMFLGAGRGHRADGILPSTPSAIARAAARGGSAQTLSYFCADPIMGGWPRRWAAWFGVMFAASAVPEFWALATRQPQSTPSENFRRPEQRLSGHGATLLILSARLIENRAFGIWW